MAYYFPFLIVTIEYTRPQEALATSTLCVSDGFLCYRAVISKSWNLHHLLLRVPSPKLGETGIVYILDVFGIHGDILENPSS